MKMKDKNDFSYDSLLVYLLFLYPIISVITAFTINIPLFAELSINQYSGVVLLLSYYLIFKKRLFSNSLLIPFLILYGINIASSSSPWVSIRDIMPINLVINLSILFFSGKFKIARIDNKVKNIIFTITLAGFYVFILGIDRMKDQYVGSYHAGIFGLPHTAAYYLLIIFIYTAIIDRKFNIFYFLSFLGILLSGVRTVIITAIVFLALISIPRLDIRRKENVNYLLKFIPVIFLLIILILIKPGMFESTTTRMQELAQFDNLEEYGSGRLSISKFILSDFNERDVLEMFTGKPVIEEYAAAEAYFGVPLWAHNDFFMILYVLGFIGLAIYAYYIIIKPLRYVLKEKEESPNPNTTVFLYKISMVVIIALLAIGNGFYVYLMSHVLLYFIILTDNRQDLPKNLIGGAR